MNLLSLASRNIYRNSHRTAVTTLAMAFACAMMIVFSTLIEGFVIGSERNVVAMNTADIQVHQFGYRDDPDIYHLITNSQQLATDIRAAGYTASERLFAYGLLASEQSSSGIQLRGVDLTYEATVTELHQHIMHGSWLRQDDPYGIVIGKKLARLLDVDLGSELIFVGQTADGYMANDRFFVRGVLKSISAGIDNSGVFMSSDTLRELIALPEGSHELVIMRPDRNTDLTLASEEIMRAVGNQLEVLNWKQLMPVINRFLETAYIQTMIMMLFTYVAVASVVLNAMLMSVFERIHEFGIMKAIGVKPWQLVRLVYAETGLQTLLAVVVGMLIGGVVSWYLQKHGLDMSALTDGFSFAGVAFDPVWYAAMTVPAFALPALFLFLIAGLAVIYPAVKVAMIRPVEAIHHQ
jgi:ABC-type lipoprotein release transport system permease subunit